MEPRSRETTPTKEDLDFIVDDGYRSDMMRIQIMFRMKSILLVEKSSKTNQKC